MRKLDLIFLILNLCHLHIMTAAPTKQIYAAVVSNNTQLTGLK